jgi:acylphosphatase
MREGIGACWACERPLPAALVHDHHKKPQAAGGGDERPNRSVICPLCHTCVHQATRLHLKGKTNGAKDLVNVYVQGEQEIAGRLWELIKEEAQAWAQGTRSEIQKVTIEIERGFYSALKGIGGGIEFNGKPLGAKNLIRFILTNWLRRYVADQGGEHTFDFLEPAKPEPPQAPDRPQIVGRSKQA